MITLEHKKLINKHVLKWEILSLYRAEWFVTPKTKINIKDFDPTGKHFYEILGKLTSEQKEKIKYIMSWRDRDVNPSIWDNHSNPHPIDTALWIESHKEEAITALIEVLEGMK